MKTASILTIGCAAMALSITSCTNFGSPNTYNLNEIGGAQETYTGTVTSVENVKIQANNANTGTGIGAVAGGLIGAATVSVGQAVFFPGGISLAAITTISFIASAAIFALMLMLLFKKDLHPIKIIALSAALGSAIGYAFGL